MIPPITTIVVNWNRSVLLARCLATLRRQTVPCETIVVDNGSNDGSVEMVAARFPEVRLIRLPENRGFTGGNNVGLQHTKTPFVFLLNNDTELEPDCLERLATCLVESPDDVAGVFPKVLFDDDRHLVNAFGAVWHHRVHWLDVRVGQIDGDQFRSRERVFGSILAAVLLRQSALDDVGTFDEAFLSYGEDFDLCYRANILGWSFVAEPAAIVYHRHRGSAQVEVDPLWHHFLYVRNYLLVFLKNYSAGNLVRHFPWAFYRYYVAGLRAAVRRRDWNEVALFGRVLRSLVGLLPHVLGERRRLQRRRKVPDREVWSFAPVEDFNLFCPDGNYVLSRLNLLLGSEGASRRYEVEGREYVVP